MICYITITCLQGRCHVSLFQDWNNIALMPAENFCVALKKTMIVFYQTLLLGLKAGFTTMCRKQREQEKNGAIPCHQTRRNFTAAIWKEACADFLLGFFFLRALHASENTVIRATNTDHRNHFSPDIKSIRFGLLSQGVLFQYDNAWPTIASSTAASNENYHSQRLPHLPCSLDLAACEPHLFGRLKVFMGRLIVRAHDSVQQGIHEWPHTRPREFFSIHVPSTLKNMEV